MTSGTLSSTYSRKFSQFYFFFRNFCKMDVNNGVVKFTRRIDSISVDCVLQEGEREGPYDICRVKITAKAFLWHQVFALTGSWGFKCVTFHHR